MGRRSERKRATVGATPPRAISVGGADRKQPSAVKPAGANGGRESLRKRSVAGWLCDHRTEMGICLFLIIATLAVFGQTISHEFVSYDDNDYVYENRHVRGGLTLESIAWAFTHDHSANWHPLTTLSHMLDCSLYGLWAGGHHSTNVLLHAAASVAIFLALRRLTGAVSRSGIVAALFCLHPLHVESVAWISERKDVLSGLFFGLTLWAYAGYAQRPFSRARYASVVALFAMGLLCKPMLVTLPFLLLVLDYWPLGRLRGRTAKDGAGTGAVPPASLARLLVEKLPLMVLAAASCVVTYSVQASAGAMSEVVTPIIRVQTAVLAYVRYLAMMIWPFGLSVTYPRDREPMVAAIAFCGLLLAAITWGAVLWNRRGGRYALAGWIWYAGMLVPVCGLVAIGDQSMADRYTYLPLVGLFLAIVWCGAVWLGEANEKWGLALAFAVIVLYAAVSTKQCGYWHDSERLFRHAVAITPENGKAHSNLGKAILDNQGPRGEAVEQFRKAIEVNPRDYVAHTNLGLLERENGNLPGAIQHYQEAIAAKPNHAMAHNNLAVAYAAMGRMAEAERTCRDALQIDADFSEAHSNLARALASQGRYQEAVPHYRRTIELSPGSAQDNLDLGIALAAQVSVEEGVEQCKTALKMDPNYVEGRNELAKIYHQWANQQSGSLRLRSLQAAADQWVEVLRRRPNDVTAAKGLGMVLVKEGRGEDALPYLKRAMAAEPRDLETRKYMAFAHLAAKATDDAAGDFQEVLRQAPSMLNALECADLLRSLPGQAAVARNLGIMFVKAGRGPDSMPLFELALTAEPHDLEARKFKARALIVARKMREAMGEFREILHQDPQNQDAANTLAWIEATSADAALRNGKEAVELAQKAVAKEKCDLPELLDTLAAAYAETGRFKEAVETARKAKEAAKQGKDQPLVDSIQSRLDLYESKKPYRDTLLGQVGN
jgi:protein O-mannosyl-transferase